MRCCEQTRRDEDDRTLRDRALAEKFAETFEHPRAIQNFFAEAGGHDDDVKHWYNGLWIPGDKMISPVDRRRSKERHNKRFHRELERHAKDDADGDRFRPTTWPHKTEFTPRRVRNFCPNQNEDRAQRRDNKISAENDQDREDPERAEAAQSCRKLIVGLSRRNNFRR